MVLLWGLLRAETDASPSPRNLRDPGTVWHQGELMLVKTEKNPRIGV